MGLHPSGSAARILEVRSELGEEIFCWFLVVQGSPENPKYRPIDDFKESGVNSADHALDHLRLHDVDFFVTLCRFICSSVSEQGAVAVELRSGQLLEGRICRDLGQNCKWVGRCLDLEKAYKQVPLSASSLKVRIPAGARALLRAVPVFPQQQLSVRCMRGSFQLQPCKSKLAACLLSVIGGVFYDDFPMIEPRLTAMPPSSVPCPSSRYWTPSGGGTPEMQRRTGRSRALSATCWVFSCPWVPFILATSSSRTNRGECQRC